MTAQIRRFALFAALACAATASQAHDGHGAHGFAAGLLHPFTGLDHLLAMLAVGLWATTLGKRTAWSLPIAFPLLMAVGAAAAIGGLQVPAIEPAIAASVLVLGLAVAGAWRAPQALAIGLVAVFGFAHGFAHGVELPPASNAMHYAAGFLLATAALHAIGIAIGSVRAVPRGVAALRAAGIGITLAGSWLLAGASGLV